jgi:hypothetical protein
MIAAEVAGARAVKIRLLPKIVFLLAGTFLHELTHYIAALILGRPAGFSVVPRICGDSIVLGSVTARTRFQVFSSFIAIAPLIWWPVLYRFFMHFALPSLKMKPFSLENLLFLWLGIQLLWAGRLSSQDVRNFFAGLFSFSGLFLLLTIAALFLGAHYFHPGLQ